MKKHGVGKVPFPWELVTGSFEAHTAVKVSTCPANSNARRHFLHAVVFGHWAHVIILSKE